MHDIDNWSEKMALRVQMILSKVLGEIKKIFGKREDISLSQNMQITRDFLHYQSGKELNAA